ncbi:MAG TPA: hypothetical protein VG935_00315 [Patescibacteria group bacterium]|nr:hypothetical protein [Patescibacteria group bacterium]
MKNKKVVIAAVVVIVLLIAGGVFFLTKKSPSTSNTTTQSENLDENIPKLSPSDVGLKITSASSNHQVKFTLNNASGITHLEYELSYEADSTGENDEDTGTGRITRGVAGEDTLDGTQSTYESKLLDLGSCSSGTCRYDKGVTGVHLLLKLTKSDGKVYQVEDSLNF